MHFDQRVYYDRDADWAKRYTAGRYAEVEIVTTDGVKRAYVDERNGVLTFDFEVYDRATYGGGE